MFSPTTVKRLLLEEDKRMSDMAEYIFGDRRHSVKHFFDEGANPTARVIEGMAEFFHVPIDVLFNRKVASTAGSGSDNELLRKLVISQEDTIQLLKAENEALKEQIKLLKAQK